MTGKTNIARPYAIAAFEYAVAKQAIAAWEKMLQAGALLASNATMKQLLDNPQLSSQQITALFCDILASQLNAEQTNFIKLLGEHQRFDVLPEIATLFEAYRAEREKQVTVQLTSATVLDALYLKKISEKLTKRLQREVMLQCEVDPNLIAGVMIRAGDTVIDGSVRGKLTRLLESL